MQAIVTKYLSATNFRGSRYKATSASGLSVTASSDDRLNSDENHRAVADALFQKLSWADKGKWELVGGHTKDGMAFVMVLTDKQDGTRV